VAITALTSALSDSSAKVRQAALYALESVAGKGHKAAIAGVTALLEHKRWSIRWSAVGALARVAHRDDVMTKKVISGYFCHPHQRVRDVAAYVISNVFGTGAATPRSLLLEATTKLASGGESIADADLDGEQGSCEEQHECIANGGTLDSIPRHKTKGHASRVLTERRRNRSAFFPLRVKAPSSRVPPEAMVAAMAYKAERNRQAWRRWVRCFGRAQTAMHGATSSPMKCKRPLSDTFSPDAKSKSSCSRQHEF